VEIAAGTLQRCSAIAVTRKLETVSREFLPNDPFAAIGLDLINRPYHHARQTNEENMKNPTHLLISALSIATFALLAPTSFAQKGAAMSKAQAIAQQLNLTPQQKEKVLPILADEVPKVRAIKNDNSLSKFQKIQQLKTIHQQTDPQMKAILSPEQYQKLKTIRQQTIGDAVAGRY
jgi:Spy/CpxP family protein refolding chaperone